MSKYSVGDFLVNKRVITVNEEYEILEVLPGSSDVFYRIKKDDGSTAFIIESEFEEQQ